MQKKVSLHKLENVFFLLVFLSGVAIFYGSSTVSDFLSSTTLTAKTYGMIVSGCLTVASGAKLLLNLAGAVKKEKQEMISFAEVPRMVICAVAMVVYCYGISNIGYFTCTTLFCILMLITLELCYDWYGPLTVEVLCALLAVDVALSVLLYVL